MKITKNGKKRCSMCLQYKSFEDFYTVEVRGKLYPSAKCKVCTQKYQKGWIMLNADRIRERVHNKDFVKKHLKRKRDFCSMLFRCMSFSFADTPEIFKKSLELAQKNGFQILEKNKIYYGKVILARMKRYNNYRHDDVVGLTGYYHKTLNYFIPLYKNNIVEFKRFKGRQLKLVNSEEIQKFLGRLLQNG